MALRSLARSGSTESSGMWAGGFEGALQDLLGGSPVKDPKKASAGRQGEFLRGVLCQQHPRQAGAFPAMAEFRRCPEAPREIQGCHVFRFGEFCKDNRRFLLPAP